MFRKGNASWVGLFAIFVCGGCHSNGWNNGIIPHSLPGMKQSTTSTSHKPKVNRQTELPSPEAARVCYATAREMEKNSKFEGAIAFYEKASMHDPSINVSEKLAVLYDKQGHFEKAVREFRKATNASPKDARILNNMGYAYYNQGHWKEAEKILHKAVAADPGHKRAWLNLGLCLGQQNRYMEALEAFKSGLKSEAQAYSNLGFVFMTQKKYHAATTAYARALELEPTLEIARKTLAVLRNKVKEPHFTSVSQPQNTIRAQSAVEENVPSYVPTKVGVRSTSG